MNKVQRNAATYLIIPEHHKDGAIHMHGLLSGNFEMTDSGRKTKSGLTIYNMPDWKFGYSTAIELDENVGAISRYITKYISKEFRKIFGSFYYAGGHGLIREPPAYKRLMKKLKPNDTLFIKSIDRLGRNYEEILEQWRIITKDKQAVIVVIDMPLLDTRQKDRDLTGILIADIVLQLLSYVAQTEREYNHQRQAEGIAIARAKGVRFGRPPLERPENFSILHTAWKNKEISARCAAKQLGIAYRTFLLWANGI